MRPRFEFALHTIASGDVRAGVDPTLSLMGAEGWEIRGIAAIAGGGLEVALQRAVHEVTGLPDEMTLAASLQEPLSTREL
jgi:phosphoribosylaminoimidazole (AIR) synthetase